jgi:hypothetical protein
MPMIKEYTKADKQGVYLVQVGFALPVNLN